MEDLVSFDFNGFDILTLRKMIREATQDFTSKNGNIKMLDKEQNSILNDNKIIRMV